MKTDILIISALLITVAAVAAGLGIYYYTLPAPSTPKTPKTPRIASHALFIESVGDVSFFVVRGVIQNNLTTFIGSVNVTATFYDEDNKTIGESSGHAKAEVVAPEQRASFEVYASSSMLAGNPSGYKLTVSCFETDKEPVIWVEFTDVSGILTADGYYKILGNLQNNGRGTAVAVSVVGVFYNSSGNLIAMSRVYGVSEMDAGASFPFELSSEPYKVVPAHYELFAVVDHYKPLERMNYGLLALMIATFTTFVIYMKRRGW